MPEPGSNFLNPGMLKIDPSLGIIDTGVTDVAPASFNPDTGEPSMPAVVATGRPNAKRQFYKFKPGGTLAERLGTAETVDAPQPEPEIVVPSQPMKAPERIVPRMRQAMVGKDMSETLKHKVLEVPEVEQSIVISDPASHASVPEGVPVPSDEFKPAIKADLKGLVLSYIKKYGVKQSAEFFGKSESSMTSWMTGNREPPLECAQMILDKSPKARDQYLKVAEKVFIDWETGEGSFAREHTREQMPVDLCFCVKGDIPPYVFWALQTAVAQYGIGCKMLTDTILIRSRNMVAGMFLAGKAEWSIWIDADILPTIGNAAWWHAIVRDGGSVNNTSASYDFIKRLLSHNKPFVGGVFATRRKNGPLVIQPDLHPRGHSDKAASEAMRKNQAKGLLEVDWLSTGLCCVHRSVFETVRNKRPDLQPKMTGEPYPFFTPTGNNGEDVAFSILAKEAGFRLYLDQELVAAHIGRYAFIPSESQFNGTLDFTNV